jgi:hypothetical protein
MSNLPFQEGQIIESLLFNELMQVREEQTPYGGKQT